MKLIKLHKYSTQKFLMLIYISIILISFIMGSIILVIFTAEEIEQDYVNFMSDISSKIEENINVTFKNVELLSTLHMIDSNLIDILSRTEEEKKEKYYKDMLYIDNVINHTKYGNPLITGITYIRRNKDVFSNLPLTPKYLQQLNKCVDELNTPGKNKVISDLYNSNMIWKKDFISITKRLYDDQFLKLLGYISINIDYDKLTDLFDRNLKENTVSNFLIIQNNNIIYNSNKNLETDEKKLIEIINTNWNSDTYNIFKKQLSHENYLLVGSEEKTTGWKIIEYMPYSIVTKHIFNSIRVIFFILLFLLITSLVAGYYVFNKMILSINKLHTAMEKIEKGELVTIPEAEESQDIMAMLIKSFNRMSIKLKESIDKVYMVEIRQRKVQLKMLQMQINPHFLYNTLNLISSIAVLEDIPSIYTISDNLSHMFRYNIKGSNIVKLQDEIDHIKKYISIQEFRFPNKFIIEYDIEEDLVQCKILKFLLQPLVENSFHHGLEKISGERKLYIIIKRQSKSTFIITIQDNGIGIESRVYSHLKKQLDEDFNALFIESNPDNLGILNVHNRIREYYGKEYGLQLKSKENQGTSISLLIPIIKEVN